MRLSALAALRRDQEQVLGRAYVTQVLNPWYLQKKFGYPQWPIAQYEFRI
jgi:hypothetical protein